MGNGGAFQGHVRYPKNRIECMDLFKFVCFFKSIKFMLNIIQDIELRIAEMQLIEIDLPQHDTFSSSVGIRTSRRALILKCIDIDGYFGFGECSARTDPFYSHEFLDACVQVIRDFIFPLLMRYNFQPFSIFYHNLERIKGWQFAKAAVLDAIFNTWQAASLPHPLSAVLNQQQPRVPVGISLGFQNSLDSLLAIVDLAVHQGYRRIKLKISPQQPLEQLERIRTSFPNTNLLLDANGSFSEKDFRYFEQLEAQGFSIIEQPFPAERLDLCSKIRQIFPNLRICLDESVSTLGHLYSAIQMSALDELNIKVGRVGGLLNALALTEVCCKYEIPTWVGGMFETGIGRTNNLLFAAFIPQVIAHDISPSIRYFPEDITAQPLTMDENGYIQTPKKPPIADEAYLSKYKVKEERLVVHL